MYFIPALGGVTTEEWDLHPEVVWIAVVTTLLDAFVKCLKSEKKK